MSDNLRDFTLDMHDAAKAMTEDQLVLAHRYLALNALDRVVRRTPVDTGRTRGNWQSTIGAPAGGQVERLDPTGAAAIQEGKQSAEQIKPFDLTYLTNNVDHILVLEEGGFVPKDPGPSEDPRPDRTGRVLVRGGFSVQAPQGMVGLTFQELDNSIIREGQTT